MKLFICALLISVLSFGFIVKEMDKGYTLGVEGDVFRARINKKFLSFIGVLHDAGSHTDPFLGYFYGWWTSSDFPVEGRGWMGLHMPIYKLRDLKVLNNGKELKLKIEVSPKDDPLISIRSTYIFKEGIPGFELEREFIASEGRRFGPEGYWLGGVLTEFPISNAEPPDSYFYAGKWHNTIEHSWSEPLKNPPLKENFVVFYWSKTNRYLVIAIPAEGYAGGINSLQFVWRGEWKEPAWWQETGYFHYGRFKARFLIGRGDREEATKRASELFRGRWSYIPFDYKIKPCEAGKVVYISNRYYRVGIDIRRGEIVSLKVRRNGRWSDELLGGKCKIYFGGPSSWQRSIYPSDPYNLYLVPKNAKAEIIKKDTMRFTDIQLISPEGTPLIKASLTFTLSGDSLNLKSEFQCPQEISIPYIGFHLDFPADSWERFYNSAGGYFHRRMLENYKMGIYDLQPCYRPIGSDLLAYGDGSSIYSFRSLALKIKDGGSDIPFLVHLPNPLFDRPAGLEKLIVSPSPYDWVRHNCSSFTFQPGRRYKLYVNLKIIQPPPQPSLGTFRLHLPYAPEVEKALEMFYLEHCFAGPISPDGMIPYFWTLAGKYNPRFNLEAMKRNLELYLSGMADGKSTRDEEGNLLPKGMLPIVWLGENKWMWRWNKTGYIFETNAQFILSALEYAILSKDRIFISSIFPKLEEALAFYRSMADENEILTLPEPFTGLPDQSRPSTYWDGWCIGHRYSLLQVYYCASAEAMEKMSLISGREEKAKIYREIKEKARNSLFLLYWKEGNLKDNEGRRIDGGRFISWIDKNGKEIDVGFTDIPLLAYYLGILPAEKAEAIIKWLDSDHNAYSWKDRFSGKSCGIPSINTIDGNKEAFYAGIWNNFQRGPGVENGQTQFWHAGFDWFMRAKFSLDDVWEKIKAFSERAMR
ncbi:hypothetical protein H5T87_10600, partial [bacterium]|nr:hypothetical protein [bacterium]